MSRRELTDEEKERRKQFGRRLAEYRALKGFSQAQLANEMRVSRTYLHDIESGRSAASVNFRSLLMQRSDVNYDWLIGLSDGPIIIDPTSEFERESHFVRTVEKLKESAVNDDLRRPHELGRLRPSSPPNLGRDLQENKPASRIEESQDRLRYRRSAGLMRAAVFAAEEACKQLGGTLSLEQKYALQEMIFKFLSRNKPAA